MALQQFNSSLIAAADWSDGTLTVEFDDGTRYRYEGVSEYTWQRMQHAPSKGKFFHTELKGRYRTERVREDDQIST